MLSFPPTIKIFTCSTPIDMRNSFDGLCGCVQQLIKQDPLSGHLFVFFNKQATMVKILMWYRTGFCIWYKRLDQGRFSTSSLQNDSLELPDLLLILEGINLSNATRRKRFRLVANS